MYKPNTHKIHSLLAYFRDKTKDTFISAPAIYSIFFHADITHLNNYGRLITFDTYAIGYPGIITPNYLSNLIVAQTFDFPFDQDAVSKSDLNQLDESLHMYRHYRYFVSFVFSFIGIRKEMDKINFLGKGSIPITLKMMLSPDYTDEQVEELEFMHEHSSAHSDDDLEIPKDI